MEYRIETLAEKKLIGLHCRMSLAQNTTGELWQRFMARRKEITNHVSRDLISMQVFDPAFNTHSFTPDTSFVKWACVEVCDFTHVPEGMNTFTLPGGLYAVFLHRGAADTGPQSFRYIFGTWLPASRFVVDDRPHFELLGAKYKNNDPASEEELWIPVRQ